MKKITAILTVALALTSMASCGGNKYPQPITQAPFLEYDTVRDLALIYQGGAHRIDWNEEEFEPYVTHKFGDGTEDWLFDGYLFLEFKDGRGAQLSPGYDSINANKEVWEWYLDRIFEPGKSLDALDKVIGKKKQEIGDPGFKHKVALTAVVPLRGQTDWGELDGKALDFNNVEDQKQAIRWFIDQLVDRFNKANYENLDFYAIYWIDEDMVHTNDFPKQMTDYVHEKGLDFIWIPYFKAAGAERWKELGFDAAYQQPNHFFNDNIPDSRLDEAVEIAKKYGMGMEFECDSHALSQDTVLPRQYRMKAYIDAYERDSVFEKAPLAYYTGGHMLTDMYRNPSPENQAIMDRLARHIVDRRKRALGK